MKNQRRQLQKIFLLLLTIALALQSSPLLAGPSLQPDATLQKCDLVDEAALQDELNQVTQQVFSSVLASVDMAAVVENQWQKLGVDAVIDAEVDRAVVQVKNEKDLWDTFLSGWSAEKAEELTRAVASTAFESEAFAAKLEELSSAVANELAQQIAVLSAESASAAFYCLQTFIAGNYASVMVRQFEKQVQSAAESVDFAGSSELDTSILTVLDQHRTALGGVGVIIAAQIARRVVVNIGQQIARRVAGRIVGRVLGRIGSEVIPIVGWVVGTGMIAYDLYTSREGALPEIQKSLKSMEVKAGIRSEMVAVMEPEFRREAPQIARDVANDLFNRWRAVKRDIRQVLDLADTDPAFAAIMDGMESPEELAKLVSLVGIALPALGQEKFEEALADGSLEQALALPSSAYRIIEASNAIEPALAWSALAGERIDEVVDLELYKHMAPEDLTRSVLEQLLALGDRATVEKLALLDLAEIEALLTISSANLKALASKASPEDLKVVAGYMPLVSPEQKNALISRLVSDPEVITQLQRDGVQQQLIASNDLDAALAFLASPKDLASLYDDVQTLLTGRVGTSLFLYKYGAGQSTLIGVGLVLLLLILVRLLYGLMAWLVSPVTSLLKRPK